MAERPHLLPLERPAADLSLTLDRPTLEYIGYREFTLGSLVVPSCEMLNRRMGDVAPDVAEAFERGIWQATQDDAPATFGYVIRGHDSLAVLTVRGQRVQIQIQRLRNGRH